MSLNVLLITLDQFRADCLSIAGHPLVKTPNLDRLAQQGVRLTKHYSQCAPCSPGRASLYTGMYQMNHRVVANGTPLDRSFDNVALLAQRAGYAPALLVTPIKRLIRVTQQGQMTGDSTHLKACSLGSIANCLFPKIMSCGSSICVQMVLMFRRMLNTYSRPNQSALPSLASLHF